jgi:hypothetical protein
MIRRDYFLFAKIKGQGDIKTDCEIFMEITSWFSLSPEEIVKEAKQTMKKKN